MYRNRVIQHLLTMGYSPDSLEKILDQLDFKTTIGYHLLIGLTPVQSALLLDCGKDFQGKKEPAAEQEFPLPAGEKMDSHAGSPCC
jgi:hypothetical protein